MEDWQKIIDNEKKLCQLYKFIYQHDYIKQKENSKSYLQNFDKNLEILAKKIKILEKKRGFYQKILEIEQEKSNFYNQSITKVKNQETYLEAKAQKKISQQFLIKYQNQAKEIGLMQKKIQENFSKIQEKKDEIIKKLENSKNIFAKETAEYKKQFQTLIAEQEKNIETFDNPFRRDFLALHKQEKFPVVVAVKQPYCTACNMNFPPQFFQEILAKSFSFCTNCKRILVIHKDHLASK